MGFAGIVEVEANSRTCPSAIVHRDPAQRESQEESLQITRLNRQYPQQRTYDWYRPQRQQKELGILRAEYLTLLEAGGHRAILSRYPALRISKARPGPRLEGLMIYIA